MILTGDGAFLAEMSSSWSLNWSFLYLFFWRVRAGFWLGYVDLELVVVVYGFGVELQERRQALFAALDGLGHGGADYKDSFRSRFNIKI